MHSAAVATIGADMHPQIRTIDMMLYDDRGVYFLTARGKAFYAQLMDQQYIALSATKDKRSVSLRGKVRNIGKERLDEIFEKNPYMQGIYPGDTRSALEVFLLYDAAGEFYEISDPSHVLREEIRTGGQALQSGIASDNTGNVTAGTKGAADAAGDKTGISGAATEQAGGHYEVRGYHIGPPCTGCGLCLGVCPQKCIDITAVPAVIVQSHCLHCGACLEACPEHAVERC